MLCVRGISLLHLCVSLCSCIFFSQAQMLTRPSNSHIPISVDLCEYVLPVRSYLFHMDFFKRTCQVCYVQYIHTLMYNTLLSSLWLLRTHQTVRESESDTNYAEKVMPSSISLSWCFIAASCVAQGSACVSMCVKE